MKEMKKIKILKGLLVIFFALFSFYTFAGGLNLVGTCKNTECDDCFRKVDCNIGMGDYWLVKDEKPMSGKCPMCDKDFVAEAFSFTNCLFKVGNEEEKTSGYDIVSYDNLKDSKNLKCEVKDRTTVPDESEKTSPVPKDKGLGYFKENYLDCFYTITNVQGFNQIIGRIDYLTPGGKHFSSWKTYLEENSSDLDGLFNRYKNGLVGESVGIFAKGFKLITNDRCRNMMERDVAFSLEIIMSHFIKEMISIDGIVDGNFVNT
jgi:hypothetical protein